LTDAYGTGDDAWIAEAMAIVTRAKIRIDAAEEVQNPSSYSWRRFSRMQEIRPDQSDAQHLGDRNFLYGASARLAANGWALNLGKGIDSNDVEKAMVLGALLQTHKFGLGLIFDGAVDFHLRILGVMNRIVVKQRLAANPITGDPQVSIRRFA